MAATRIYLKAGNLAVYVDLGTVTPRGYPALHLRVKPDYSNGVIDIYDLGEEKNIVAKLKFEEVQDESGSQAGATMILTIDYLATIIG